MQMLANGIVSLEKGSGLFLDGFNDTLSTLGGGKISLVMPTE